MKAKTIITTVLLMSASAFAQDDDKNLVQNPGFETLDGRLKKQKQIEVAKHWYSPTDLKADLYSRSVSSDQIGVPNNYQGMEEPHEGDNYAGIRVYSYNDKEARTYIMTELLGPLKKGVEYCVSFRVSLSERSKYASNNIGAHLSKKPLEAEGKISLLLDKVQVKQSQNKIFTARFNWEPICQVITAEGGEKWLTIGNFDSNKDTDDERMKKPREIPGAQTYDAYYYIDDVRVFPLDSIEECQCEQKDISTDKVEVVFAKTIVSKNELKWPELVEASTIYFAPNSDELTETAKKELDYLAVRLSEEPSVKLQVLGHSDSEEAAAAKENPLFKYMARKRLNTVVGYLEEKGVDKTRLEIIVKDAEEPADDADNPIAHAKNRRVEFVLR